MPAFAIVADPSGVFTVPDQVGDCNKILKVVDVKPEGSVVAVPASLTTTFSLYPELPYSATPQGARAIIL